MSSGTQPSSSSSALPTSEPKLVFVHELRTNYHVLIKGDSCKIHKISATPPGSNPHKLNIEARDDVTRTIIKVQYFKNHNISASLSPIPKDAVLEISASLLGESDYSNIQGRDCIITRVKSLGNHSDSKVRMTGLDLVDGSRKEDILEGATVVKMSDRPLGTLMPRELLKATPAVLAAAALWRGYYTILKGKRCQVTLVQRRTVELPMAERMKLRVIGREIFTDKVVEDELMLHSLIVVSRIGVDAGARNWQ
ncbi:hypothetical protein MMC28_000505 [Mycoblastus sanguinarius]|nr:hypothetical protein [Mycoblastus sanguinarius]